VTFDEIDKARRLVEYPENRNRSRGFGGLRRPDSTP
jgi:hypothetical protein